MEPKTFFLCSFCQTVGELLLPSEDQDAPPGVQPVPDG